MRSFKKHFVSLLVLSMFASFLLSAPLQAQQEAGLSSGKANSISLRMLSFSEPGSVEALQDWEKGIIAGNVKLDVVVDGFRARSGNLMQRGPVDGKNPEDGMSINVSTGYPVKSQFLVVADVPAGVKQVNWNVLGGSAAIIGTPAGSQFIDGSHTVTPVGPATVEIENTHYAIIITRGEGTIELPYNWEEKLRSYSETNFYNLSGGAESRRRIEYKRSFTIGANQTYIILTATKLGKTDIIASCEGVSPAESLVFAGVEWVNQPKPVEVIEGIREERYDFVANIVDTDESDPIDLEKNPDAKVEFRIEVAVSENSADIPKDLLVFRIFPDRKPNWWSNTPPDPNASRTDSYCFKWVDLPQKDSFPGSKTIPAGRTATVTISPRQVDMNVIEPGIQIENTELYFVGPWSSGNMNAHGIRTNESTTVVAGEIPIVVSGLASVYDGDLITLRNQDNGPIYIDAPIEKVIPPGAGNLLPLEPVAPVTTVKFHVESKRNGKVQRADGSVTLR